MKAFLIHAGVQIATAAVTTLVAELNHASWNDMGWMSMAMPALATLVTTTYNQLVTHKQ